MFTQSYGNKAKFLSKTVVVLFSGLCSVYCHYFPFLAVG